MAKDLSKIDARDVPRILPAYSDDLISIKRAGGSTTYTAPLWLMDMAGLASRCPIGPIDLAATVSFTADRDLDHQHAEDGLAEVCANMSQPIPASLPERTLAALASLSSGPKILWTRGDWYALPYPASGLCLKYLPGTEALRTGAISWGFAVLTDLGRRTLAQHIPAITFPVPEMHHQDAPVMAVGLSDAGADLIPTVIDQDGDRYTFQRSGRRLIMVNPSGREERIDSYRDAVWRLGEMSDGATPSGPSCFVRAWIAALRHVFPTHTIGRSTAQTDMVDLHSCAKCGDAVEKIMTVNDRDTCRDLAVPLGAEVCTSCSPAG